MADDAALADETTGETLFVGSDQAIEIVIYTTSEHTTVLDTSGWTLLTLDIRMKDTAGTVKLTKDGVRSGTFNAVPGTNTQKWTFTLTDDDLTATTFTGNEFQGRYSIWRKDAGSEKPVRYGDCTITRTTQT